MADVPFATNLLNTIAPLIAEAPGAVLPGQAIGNLPDAYWAGQNQEYQQRQRDLFKNGIPPDMATALLKAAGAAGVPEYIALQKLAVGQQLANQPSPSNYSSGGGNTGYTVPMSAVTSPSSAEAAQAAPPTQGTATLRDIATAQNIPIDQAMALTRSANPDAPLNFDQRKTMVAALTGGATEPTTFAGRFPGTATTPEGASAMTAPPMGGQLPPSVGSPNPARPQPQPVQAPAGAPPSARIAQGFEAAQENPVLQAQRLQERQLEATAQRAELDAADARRKGKAAAAIGDEALANQFKADAEASDKKADTIRQSLVRRSEMTKEQQNAAASGLTPLEYSGVVAEQAKQIDHLAKLADLGIGAKGKLAQLNEVQRLGEKVGYGVVPKVQSLLGRYGIDTRGLSDIQAYERAIDFMAPSLRPEGSGRLMQTELAAFKSSLGGLMTTPEGRRISVENLKLIHEFSSKVGEIASDTSLSPRQRYKEIYGLDVPALATTWTGPTGTMYIVKDGKIIGRAR